MTKFNLKNGKDLFLIGLTGNIACGKSVVLDMLQKRGAATIDADKVVHKLMEPGGTIYSPIVQEFGERILEEPDQHGNRSINRRILGGIVFADPEKLKKLEEISHPRVRVGITKEISKAITKILVLDAIKLIENGLADSCDAVWVVTCPPDVQLERLMKRNNFSRDEALLRIQAQPPQDEKLKRANVIIENSGPLFETEKQVQAAFDRIKPS